MSITNPNLKPTPFHINLIYHYLPHDTHNTYSITIDTTFTIQTLLTSSPSHVESWLLETQSLSLSLPSPAIIGLDIEWRPNSQRGQSNPVATLQLCTNNRCLIFQLIHSPEIPTSLLTFLSNPNNRFLGVGIESDIKKLLEDYNINVANFVDLRNLAAEVFDDRELLRSGIKSLAKRVLGKIVEKPSWITMSRWEWDNPRLNCDQITYATVDAFLSFEIARRLYSHQTTAQVLKVTEERNSAIDQQRRLLAERNSAIDQQRRLQQEVTTAQVLKVTEERNSAIDQQRRLQQELFQTTAQVLKVTEERNSAIDQQRRLQQEVELLRRQVSRSCCGISLTYVVLVAVIGFILRYLLEEDMTYDLQKLH